ncbi:unnamed protein product [Mytilus coruscus]|uniref:Uncharacterized protein n=1 Tax=Mytilus coruscus TaxID=42192 RepID=A0A6J7ZU81_MYTCO|nr:unnamed protein product [Mytilus coruscus]
MPYGLLDIIKRHCGGIDVALMNSKYGGSVAVNRQILRIKSQKFRELFKPTIDELLKYLDQLFQHPKVSEIQNIIMVGGFSDCEFVQRAMKDKFPKMTIIIPEDAGLAVLRGAVLYAHQPKPIRSLENDSDDEDSEEEKEAMYYFRKFKMALHNESVDMDSLIKDESGFKMKALDIFTFAIKYLKDQTINKLKRTLTDVDIADIHYVLPVPAIWEDKAKMFMRKSTEEAGIKGDQLTIALEPEAASIYCQELRTDRENKTNITFSETIKKGMKYVVVDLGDN